jgi:hypothetical protein
MDAKPDQRSPAAESERRARRLPVRMIANDPAVARPAWRAGGTVRVVAFDMAYH